MNRFPGWRAVIQRKKQVGNTVSPSALELTDESAGVPDQGKIPVLNDHGKIDITMIPSSAGGGGPVTADDVSYDPVIGGSIQATTVEEAIQELDAKVTVTDGGTF